MAQVTASFVGADGDPVAALPEAAAKRWYRAEQRRDESFGPIQTANRQMEELRGDRVGLEATFRRHKVASRDRSEPDRDGYYTITEGDPLAVMKIDINFATKKMRRLEAVVEDRLPTWNARGNLCTSLDRFLRSVVPGSLRALPEPKPYVKGDIVTAIETCQRKRREIAAQIEAVEASPPTMDAIQKEVSAYCATMRETRCPSISRLLFGGKIEMPTIHVRGMPIMPEGIPVTIEAVDVEGLVNYALGGALEKQLLADATRELAELEKAGATPMSEAERAKRRVELNRDLLACERDEVALIELAWHRGMTGVEMQADANPLAVLNVDHAAIGRPS